MKQKLSDYIANFIVNKGIKDIFTVTGGGAMHLNDSFGHHPELRCIYNHHEQASAMAAEAYSRLTNKLSLVCVTSGPGGTNTLTGVLGGWLDSTPMFIISGQVKKETTVQSTNLQLRQLGDQEFNIVKVVESFTKYSHMLVNPNDVRYALEKCFYHSLNGRGGPVWLDIPLDVQGSIIETDDLMGFNPVSDYLNDYPNYNLDFFQEIFSKITLSKKPVIYVGNGIRLSGQYNNFIQLINLLKIPVVTAWNAHDILSNNHPMYCGRPGTIGTRGGNFVVENSDLMIVLGSRLNIRQVSYNYQNFAINTYKIMIDVDQAEMDKPTIKIDLKIRANLKDFLPSFLMFLENKEIPNFSNWINWCRQINDRFPAVLEKHYQLDNYVNPYAFINELFRKLDDDEIIVTGNGSACVVTFQTAIIKERQRLFTNSGCASMGYGIPAAIGCSFAKPNQRIICIEGDGSLQMNIQELQTIVYHNSNIKIIIFNNDGYHSIRQTQTNVFKNTLVGVNKDNGISFPSLEVLSKAYGIKYSMITHIKQFENVFSNVFDIKGPAILEVFLDPKQYFEPKLSSKVLEDGKIISPRIDDMFPFLSREEYESIHYHSEENIDE